MVPDRLIQNKAHRDETEVSKILRKFKGDDVFLGCVVLISTVFEAIYYTIYNVYFRSRPCVLNA